MVVLAKNATVADVLGTVWDADKFVSRIVGNMNRCWKQHGNAFVRIGVSGTGHSPNHLVLIEQDGKEIPFGAFDTFGNQRFEDVEIGERDWSTSRSSNDDIRAEFARIRGLPTPAPLRRV